MPKSRTDECIDKEAGRQTDRQTDRQKRCNAEMPLEGGGIKSVQLVAK